MITSHDLLVGADAFLQSGAQVLDDVEFTRGASVTCMAKFRFENTAAADVFALRRATMGHDSTLRLMHLGFFEQVTPALPITLVRRVMGEYERGTASDAAYAWLCRTEADDDLEVLGIHWHVVNARIRSGDMCTEFQGHVTWESLARAKQYQST